MRLAADIPFELPLQKVPRDLLQALGREHVLMETVLPAESSASLSQVIPLRFRQSVSLEQGLKQQRAAKNN